MKAYKEYLNKLIDLIIKVRDTQDEKFELAADAIADAIEDGKTVHYWGPGGHSSIFAEDVMYREGELAKINPIIDPNISLSHGGLKEINYLEKCKDLGKVVVKYNRIKLDDIVIIGTAYGVNPVCIEGALECKRIGAKLIAITSPSFSDDLEYTGGKHESNKGLYEIADIFLNSFTPPVDLLIERKGLNQKFGPTSTIMQILTLKALNVTVIEKLIERGNPPAIWKDALEEGGVEFNKSNLNILFGKVKSL